MHRVDRRQQHAGEAREPDAERGHRRHVGLQRNAERADHVRVLHAGAHHAAERRLLQQEPEPGNAGDRDADQHHAIERIDEAADHHLPAQCLRNRIRQRRRAENHTQGLLRHHGEAEGEQERQDRIGAIEAAEQRALDDDAEQRHQHRRQHQRAAEAEIRRDHQREIRADGKEGAVREIDDAAEREDQRQPERDEEIINAVEQSIEDLLHQEHGHGTAFGCGGRMTMHAGDGANNE